MNNQLIERHEARLAALYEVSSQLGKSLDLGEVLNQVMDSIIQLTGAERGFLMLYDAEKGSLQTRAARNFDQETIEADAINISHTVIERAIETGEGILSSNAQEDDRFSGRESVVGYQLRSIMCAPLRVRSQTLGAVYVDNRLFSGVFEKDDLGLLVTFANQAAIAIENARLFTQTDQALARRVEELSLFQRIDQQLNRSLELNQVLSLSLNWAIALTNAAGGSIGLFEELVNEDTGMLNSAPVQVLRLMVFRGEDEHSESRLVSLDHPIVQKVMRDGRSILTHNVTENESVDGTPASVQLAVPIQQDGIITGLITLETQHNIEINREDIAFVERLSDRAAVAIKNAKLYEAIQDANKAKSEFISLVAHELRVPMTSIKGYTDLMNAGLAGPLSDQQKQFLEVIRRNLTRMSSLISDLSDINHIESGRMKFDLQPLDLREVVADVTDSLRERIGNRQQTLHIEIEDDLPLVFADTTRIAQVVSNLLSNANKYTQDGGEIVLKAWPNGRFAYVSIQDNGLGISEENQQKLFTEFFRAEDKAVREQAGWGLGLSIVRRMVEAQNGEVTFESKLGEGSTFTFTIPLANMV
ncbi:MAG: GAF domain-containing protein [Ardenticatenaceae bacterium]|nr:GAF domain-containing protein [Anaerolineales bacterium]MCB8938908.1 GAF domain-containing protein [Ardenticatenaceae bacterium]MCB8974664.1 GAF domain-containing protein [Ardenticatenaceae bacterium]